MKNTLSLSLLALFLVPAQLGATVVRASIWQRPNGTRVVILENDTIVHHTETSIAAEKQQALECVTYVCQNKNNVHVFLPKFNQDQRGSMQLDIECTPLSFETNSRLPEDVHYGLCENRLSYTLLNLFTDKSFNKRTINPKLFAETLLDTSKKVTIPNALRLNYIQHQKAVEKYLGSLPSALTYRSLEKWIVRNIEKNQTALDNVFHHGLRLFITTLAAQVDNPSVTQKNTLIISEEICMRMLQDPLTALGYKHIATVGEPYLVQLYAAYGQCGGQANATEDEVTNKCALNLKDILN
jgi:hypothetical protein